MGIEIPGGGGGGGVVPYIIPVWSEFVLFFLSPRESGLYIACCGIEDYWLLHFTLQIQWARCGQ